MLMNTPEYKDAFERIVDIVSAARASAVQKASAELVRMYWSIGCELNARSEWGNKFIETLSRDIRAAFPGVRGFSVRSLKYMAKFAREVDSKLCNSYCTIPWGHIVKLLDKTDPGSEREWYRQAIIENGWSQVMLDHQIDLKLYERQVIAGKVSNFYRTLPAADSELAQQALKDPYIFDFITAKQGMQERDIEEQMIGNVTKLLLELGTGFAFMGRQYHLTVGDEDFYIDLLFYNLNLRCYVVIELKTGEFKPEYAGQLNFYLSAVDAILKKEQDAPSIGLLLCKSKNDLVAEYSLKDMSKPIGVSAYQITSNLPKELEKQLPSVEDIQSRIK